jgi:hypothetical protein
MTTEQEYVDAARTVLLRMARGRVLNVAAVLLAEATIECPDGGAGCQFGDDYTAKDCCRCHVKAIEDATT